MCYERRMPDGRFVALLRGVNVGGHNRLPMAELRAALGSAGFDDVRTYIQSGNVVFDRSDVPDRTAEATLASEIGAVLDDEFGWSVPVLVRPFADIVRVAGAHPDLGGDVPPKWLHTLLLDRVPSDSDMSEGPDPERYAPDRWVVDGREIHATYPEGSGRSKLTIDVFEKAFGATATGRNVSTLSKIVELGEQD